jgi:2-octaprenyl-6-methoxyphenol hydroxylase
LSTKGDKKLEVEIAVIGGGLAGLSAALAASQSGRKTVLVAPDQPSSDGRTSALLAENIRFLETLGVWQQASDRAAPLRTMRIIDATGRLIRAPQMDFRATEIGLSEFGYNIENKYLSQVLEAALRDAESIVRVDALLDGLDVAQDGGSAGLSLSNGKQIAADIVLAADGRKSAARTALGIETRDWRYPQVALVGNFSHRLPHHDTSTEFHTQTGPFTLVPLGDRRSSLVCVVDPAQADRFMALPIEKLNLELERRMESVLGEIRVEAELHRFQLSGMIAERFGAGSAALIGEAAHAFPPIGAQGLNLGLRDVKAAIDLIAKHGFRTPSENFGDAYHRSRIADISTRTASVDLLNRSLLSEFPPVQLVRSFGLRAIGNLGPLRRLFMQEGIDPGRSFSAGSRLFRRKRRA